MRFSIELRNEDEARSQKKQLGSEHGGQPAGSHLLAATWITLNGG